MLILSKLLKFKILIIKMFVSLLKKKISKKAECPRLALLRHMASPREGASSALGDW